MGGDEPRLRNREITILQRRILKFFTARKTAWNTHETRSEKN